MVLHLGDLVAVDANGTMGIIVGRTDAGWIVEIGDDEWVITPTCWKVIAA